jgi:hypothetical protein
MLKKRGIFFSWPPPYGILPRGSWRWTPNFSQFLKIKIEVIPSKNWSLLTTQLTMATATKIC